MKKLMMLAFTLILLTTFKNTVYALDAACTPQEQLRLRELASATQVTYEFYEDSDSDFKGYKVTISGFAADFYVYNIRHGLYFEYKDSTNVTVKWFESGETYNLGFYASSSNPCNGTLILTKYLTLIKYNPYSEDPLCKGYESYELCKKFTPIKISSKAEFEARIKQYIKDSQNKKPDTPSNNDNKTSKSLLQLMGEFITNNYMFFLIFIIIAGTAGIVTIEIKKRRSIL